jgi:hypothetical protein
VIEGIHTCPVQAAREEAERLASLPRTLANVQVNEEAKLEQVEQPVHKCHDCGQPETAYRCHSCQITYECEKQYRDEMRAERLQAERSAKREAAILDTSPTFSGIFR